MFRGFPGMDGLGGMPRRRNVNTTRYYELLVRDECGQYVRIWFMDSDSRILSGCR